MPETVGPFAAGSRYCANDIPSLRWVHATLVETALMAHDLVLPPLSAEERERYWTESRTVRRLVRIDGAMICRRTGPASPPTPQRWRSRRR